MSLISRAKSLLASSNISAALVILPLPATVANASVVINGSSSWDFGNIYSGAVSSFSENATGSTYDFSFNIGDGTQDDSYIFGNVNNLNRSNSLLINGTTTGSFSAGDTISYSYTITATLSDSSITQVTYSGYALITDSSSIIYAGGGYDSDSGSVSVDSMGFSSNSSGLTSSGSTSTDTIGSGTGTNVNAYGVNQWQICINYDWDIENWYSSSYSTEILALSISGTMTTISAVPEPASWSLMGASAAFAAVFIARRRKKTTGA